MEFCVVQCNHNRQLASSNTLIKATKIMYPAFSHHTKNDVILVASA